MLITPRDGLSVANPPEKNHRFKNNETKLLGEFQHDKITTNQVYIIFVNLQQHPLDQLKKSSIIAGGSTFRSSFARFQRQIQPRANQKCQTEGNFGMLILE